MDWRDDWVLEIDNSTYGDVISAIEGLARLNSESVLESLLETLRVLGTVPDLDALGETVAEDPILRCRRDVLLTFMENGNKWLDSANAKRKLVKESFLVGGGKRCLLCNTGVMHGGAVTSSHVRGMGHKRRIEQLNRWKNLLNFLKTLRASWEEEHKKCDQNGKRESFLSVVKPVEEARQYSRRQLLDIRETPLVLTSEIPGNLIPDDIHHTPCVDGVSARMEGSSSNPSIPQQEADNDGGNVDFEADFEDVQLDCYQASFICPSMQ